MKLLYGQHPNRANQLTNTCEGISELEFKGGVYKFYGIDSEDDYNERVRQMPANHPWRKWQKIDVKYTLNDQCYRAPNWDQINWSNSILMFGCSQTFGIGLDDSQTVPYNLELISGIPIINLGVAGSSNMFHWINTTLLRNYDIRPRAVIYAWTFAHRIAVLEKNYRTLNSGIWNIDQEPLVDAWNFHKNHAVEYMRYLIPAVNQQWQSVGCPVFNYTVCSDTKAELDWLKYLDWTGDFARDYRHLGPMKAKDWAEEICKDIKMAV